MPYCRQCGHDVDAEDYFCEQCGKARAGAARATTTARATPIATPVPEQASPPPSAQPGPCEVDPSALPQTAHGYRAPIREAARRPRPNETASTLHDPGLRRYDVVDPVSSRHAESVGRRLVKAAGCFLLGWFFVGTALSLFLDVVAPSAIALGPVTGTASVSIGRRSRGRGAAGAGDDPASPP